MANAGLARVYFTNKFSITIEMQWKIYYTCHSSTVVMAHAKSCGDHFIRAKSKNKFSSYLNHDGKIICEMDMFICHIQLTPHSLSVKVRYGVSFISSKYDLRDTLCIGHCSAVFNINVQCFSSICVELDCVITAPNCRGGWGKAPMLRTSAYFGHLLYSALKILSQFSRAWFILDHI